MLEKLRKLGKNIQKLEELGANQSTKLEIASKMMEHVKK